MARAFSSRAVLFCVLINSIAIIGPMGAGKSTLGAQLARRLRYHFVDVDAEISREAGFSIPEIFSLEGESGFRARESSVIKRLCLLPAQVISTGGGCVETAETREVLHQRALVFYLRVSPECSMARIGHSKNRPLLAVENPLGRLRELFLRRDPLYHQTAHYALDAERMTKEQQLAFIVSCVELQLAKEPIHRD